MQKTMQKATQKAMQKNIGIVIGVTLLLYGLLRIGVGSLLLSQYLGLRFIAIFLLMYTMLFINFQTVNPKVIHLAVCTVLFAVLCWLKQTPRMTSSTQLSAGSAA